MAEINKEIGLEDLLRGIGMDKTHSNGETSSSDGDEKLGGKGKDEQIELVH